VGPPPPPLHHNTMTTKKTKKPTTAELLQQLIAQVAELRGRIERMESKGPGLLTVYKTEEPRPSVSWWSWITGE